MGYVIRNGEDYICFTGKTYVKGTRENAMIFPTMKKAKGILRNCLCRPLKLGAKIIKVDDIPITTTCADVVKTEVKETPQIIETKSEVSTEIKKIEKSFTKDDERKSSVRDWANKMMNARQMIIDARNRNTLLVGELSTVDRKISDVEHFIELNKNLNTPDGYIMYKLLRDLLRDRRDIKNEIAVTKKIAEIEIEDGFKNVTDQIHALENRIYTPREMKGLFEGMR